MISRPQKKRKAQPGSEAASAAACATSFNVSLDAQKLISINRIWLRPRFNIASNLNLYMIQKNEFMKFKNAAGRSRYTNLTPRYLSERRKRQL